MDTFKKDQNHVLNVMQDKRIGASGSDQGYEVGPHKYMHSCTLEATEDDVRAFPANHPEYGRPKFTGLRIEAYI